jgi:hypothetical protein
VTGIVVFRNLVSLLLFDIKVREHEIILVCLLVEINAKNPRHVILAISDAFCLAHFLRLATGKHYCIFVAQRGMYLCMI